MARFIHITYIKHRRENLGKIKLKNIDRETKGTKGKGNPFAESQVSE